MSILSHTQLQALRKLLNKISSTIERDCSIVDAVRKQLGDSPLLYRITFETIHNILTDTCSKLESAGIHTMPQDKMVKLLTESWPVDVNLFFDVMDNIPDDLLELYVLYGRELCGSFSKYRFDLYLKSLLKTPSYIPTDQRQTSAIADEEYSQSFPSFIIGEA